jgi:hypothetical protein
MKYLLSILLFVLAFPLAIAAQQSAGGKVTAETIAGTATAVVKGAPFSAEAVSESVQTLADGNRITRSHTTKMYRDGEGRFRREGSSSGGSGFGFTTAGGAVSTYFSSDGISIFDPVANVRYFLNPASKTARRMSVPSGAPEGAVIVNGQSYSYTPKAQVEANAARNSQVVVLPGLATAVGGFYTTGNNGKTEQLGARDFEGVTAEGTRTVTTIAAGAIGNERPIEIVYERWYSKELKLIVYSKHSDPRFGEQTYRLTNINRSEPDRSLFAPPSDYKIVAEQGFRVVTTTRPQ